MPRLSDVLWRARTDAKLGEAIMCRMLGIDEGRLRKLESGETEPQPDELEAYAQAFGVGVRQLGRGEAGQAPLTQLFCRSISEGGPEALEKLIATGGHRVLGELMRCARAIAELEALLGHPKPPAWPTPMIGLTDLGEACGIVRALALEAFAAGKLSRVRVREYLKLPLTEPLPEHDALTAEQREPVRRLEDTARGIVQQYVQEVALEMSGCIATAVSRVPEGFRVDVVGFRDDAPETALPCGFVTVSHDLMVSCARLDVSALRRDPK